MAIEILVVEDEYAERQELSRIMEEITPAHHIRSASSCAAAVSAIEQLCPDLILLDIMLHGSSGFEVAEFVRSRGLACRIIILTAYHEFEFASRALSMGLQDYLLKPVRPAVLLQRVREVLHLPATQTSGTQMPLWPYLACGVASPLPQLPHLLPDLVAVGLLRTELPPAQCTDTLGRVNLALHGQCWTELTHRRLIGYCHAAGSRSPLEAAQPLLHVWQEQFPQLAAIGIGTPVGDGADLPESYRTACLAARSSLLFPEKEVCLYRPPQHPPEPYPARAEGRLLHAVRTGGSDLEQACSQMCSCMLLACRGDIQVLEQYCSFLWAAANRLCAEAMLPPPELPELEDLFTFQQLTQRLYALFFGLQGRLKRCRESRHPLVLAALGAIRQRYQEPLKLETVAREQFVNAAYLGRLFHAQTGQSFRDALTEERMRQADRLLRQKTSVSAAAAAVGYDDPNYFSRVYKKYFGYPPSESGSAPSQQVQ